MSTNDARLTARLLSACPPDAAQKAKLEDVLAKRYGRPVALSWQEDKTASGGFRIDRNTYKVFYDGTDLGLTLKEYRLLDQLISRAGVTVAREDLFREVWGDDYMGETRTLDMHIATLREKIKAAGGGDPIITVRGIGYRFEG